MNTTTRIRPVTHTPLKRLALCLDCEETFTIGGACPGCGSETFTVLAKFLDRKTHRRLSLAP